MRQHPDPDDPHHDQDLDRYDEEELEALGTLVYQGSGLSVRALTAEELQRFLDAHHGQPAQLLGSGWTAMDPPGHPLGGPRTPPEAGLAPPGPLAMPGGPPASSLGSPGRSALAAYRRRRATELAGWTRSLVWRAPLVAAAGALVQVLATQAGLPYGGLLGLAVAALVGWRLRFRPSERARSWQRGAAGERHTARLLDRLTRDGYVVFHDLAVPNSPANVDHLVMGSSGVFVIDSKQWTGSVSPGRRRAGLAQPLPPGPHPGDGPLGGACGRPAAWHPGGRAAVRPRCPCPRRRHRCPGRGHRACPPAPQRARR
jgi:Nuclease-related domain